MPANGINPVFLFSGKFQYSEDMPGPWLAGIISGTRDSSASLFLMRMMLRDEA
jgi:hypothetical protein